MVTFKPVALKLATFQVHRKLTKSHIYHRKSTILRGKWPICMKFACKAFVSLTNQSIKEKKKLKSKKHWGSNTNWNKRKIILKLQTCLLHGEFHVNILYSIFEIIKCAIWVSQLGPRIEQQLYKLQICCTFTSIYTSIDNWFTMHVHMCY